MAKLEEPLNPEELERARRDMKRAGLRNRMKEQAPIALRLLATACDREGKLSDARDALRGVPLWQTRSNPFRDEGELITRCLGCDRPPDAEHAADCWTVPVHAVIG